MEYLRGGRGEEPETVMPALLYLQPPITVVAKGEAAGKAKGLEAGAEF